MDRRIFISYCHKDAEWANEVAGQLEALGFRVWKDNKYEQAKNNMEESESGIPAGDQWPAAIEKAIQPCQGFIGLVSFNSRESKWCEKELLFAERQDGHVNILIRHSEDTPLPDGISYAYTDKNVIVWSDADPGKVWEAIQANKEFWGLRNGNAGIDVIQSPMVKRINEYLIATRKTHPSFQLMKDLEPDKELFPEGNFISNKERLVSHEGKEKKSFGDFVKDSWKEQTHLFIEGTGGVGKSVTLLTFATEEGFLPVNVAAVYVPLYRLGEENGIDNKCIDHYLKDTYAADEFDWMDRHSKQAWDSHPNLILLLDGYNEVAASDRGFVNASITRWAGRQGVQVVTTSRF